MLLHTICKQMPDSKGYRMYNVHLCNILENINYQQWFPEARKRGKDELQKGIIKLFWGDKSLLYFDCDGGFMSVYICQNVKWILNYI